MTKSESTSHDVEFFLRHYYVYREESSTINLGVVFRRSFNTDINLKLNDVQ